MNKIERIKNLALDLRYREADRAWASCLDDGSIRMCSYVDICDLARCWLSFGEVKRAMKVFTEISFLDITDESFTYTRHEVFDAVEADIYGQSVYEFSMPLDLRWKRPENVPETIEGYQLKWWAPGRVMSVSIVDDSVVLVWVLDSRTFQIEFGRSEWEKINICPLDDSLDKFFYICNYCDESGASITELFEQIVPPGTAIERKEYVA
jgi:hypothetical protein